MERIKQIWNYLEKEMTSLAGFSRMRYSDTIGCDLFLGIKFPEKHRLLFIRVPYSTGKDFNIRFEVKALKLEKIYDPDNSGYILLNLVLMDAVYSDLFDALICDMVSILHDETDPKTVLKVFTNRLSKWQALFEKFRQQGLTSEEQRGLYGELFFLRKFLKTNPDFSKIITSWVGPEKQIRDFQFRDWCVEVKTTHGNNHQKIQISNERQLDTKNILNLFFYHISLEIRQNSGETLNEIIASVSEILASDFIAHTQFKNKLLEAGYFIHHHQYYSDIGYFSRQDKFYEVEREFPRIEEKDLRNGVGDVKYSIIISQCSDYVKPEEYIFQTIGFK